MKEIKELDDGLFDEFELIIQSATFDGLLDEIRTYKEKAEVFVSNLGEIQQSYFFCLCSSSDLLSDMIEIIWVDGTAKYQIKEGMQHNFYQALNEKLEEATVATAPARGGAGGAAMYAAPARGGAGGAASASMIVDETAEQYQTNDLYEAVKKGNDGAVKKFLERGDDVNYRDAHGTSLIHLAAVYGHDKVLKTLLGYGAKKDDILDPDKITALHLAAVNGHDKVVQVLLTKGANKHARNIHNDTPLHLAAAIGHDKVVQMLVDHGADKDAKNSEGNTAMHLAAAKGRDMVVQILVEKKG